jgi:hypothetical protein
MEAAKEAIAAARDILQTLPQFDKNTLYLDCVGSIIQSAIEEATRPLPVGETTMIAKVTEKHVAQPQLSEPEEWTLHTLLEIVNRLGRLNLKDQVARDQAICDAHNAALAAAVRSQMDKDDAMWSAKLAAEREKREQADRIRIGMEKAMEGAVVVEKQLCSQLAAAVKALKRIRSCKSLGTWGDEIIDAALAKCQQKEGDATCRGSTHLSTEQLQTTAISNAALKVQSSGAAKCPVCGSKVTEDGTGIPAHPTPTFMSTFPPTKGCPSHQEYPAHGPTDEDNEPPFYNASLSNVAELRRLSAERADAAWDSRADPLKRTPRKQTPKPKP